MSTNRDGSAALGGPDDDHAHIDATEVLTGVPREPTKVEQRHTNVTLGLLTFLIAVVLAGALVSFAAYRSAGTAANNSATVAQGNELRACQAAARGPVDDSVIAYEQANKDVAVLLLNVIAAGSDNDAQADLAKVSPALMTELNQTFDARHAELDTYQDRIKMSVSDPTAFLALCRDPGF